ncbi:MAG TPA: phosphatase PAP2 family protein [Bryobacteraceae bacterium]|nr:phosphatase PAP2 family protein [Bryobacteraceae bacterium]
MRAALTGLIAAILILTLSDIIVLHLERSRAADFDLALRAVVHSTATGWLTKAIRVLTWLGSDLVLGAVSVGSFIVLRRRGCRARAWLPAVAFAAASVVTQAAKFLVRRPRPEPFFALARPETWSFPSGHSLNSMVCCLAVAAALAPPASRRRWIAAAIALSLLTGFTRVYLGVHWPTDVLTGWAAGACLGSGFVLGDWWRSPPAE